MINAMTHPPSIRQKAHRIGPFGRFAYQWHDDAVLARYQRYQLFHEIVDSWFIKTIGWFMMKKLQACIPSLHHPKPRPRLKNTWDMPVLLIALKTVHCIHLAFRIFFSRRNMTQFLQHQSDFIYLNIHNWCGAFLYTYVCSKPQAEITLHAVLKDRNREISTTLPGFYPSKIHPTQIPGNFFLIVRYDNSFPQKMSKNKQKLSAPPPDWDHVDF